MDPIKTIGTIITGAEPRDAIHLAIMALTAGEDLHPGEQIKLVFGTQNLALGAENQEGRIGIADPFITEWEIKKGQAFWCFLTPGTITGLRHEWMHPEIDNPVVASSDHELWLRQFAERWRFNYDDLIANASSETAGEWESYIVAQGRDLHSRGELGEDHDLFWHHLEALTDKQFDPGHRERFGWSCSC